MQKKNILIIGPVSAQPEDIDSIISTLSFLEPQYNLEALDSLSIMDEVSNEEYYHLWQQKLMPMIDRYDAFLGFSFGGVILQHCFPLFSAGAKPIILFSTPSFANPDLTQKLDNVINLCQQKKLSEALNALYEPVFYPNKMPLLSADIINEAQAFNRLIFGLNRVLQTNSTDLLNNNQVKHVHLIGEYSNLVNAKNVSKPKNGRLVVIPQAGMRVLQDNPTFCQKIILEALNEAL